MLRRQFFTASYWRRTAKNFSVCLILFGICVFSFEPATAEDIKVGTLRTTSSGPLFVAQERGYFAAEGVPAELVYFDASPPVAVGTVAGSIDFGITALTAGFYSLAGQGALRIIAGSASEAPGFHYTAYLASGRAYEAGLDSIKKFAGHSFALAQVGNASHYSLGLLADKYRFDLKSIRLLPLQSTANAMNAVAGGQADVGALIMLSAMAPMIQRGDIRVLGWVGDETPWQHAAVFTATKTADQRSDTVTRFLRAFRKGVHDYHDAFTGPAAARQDGPTATEIVAIVAKYTGIGIDDVKLGPSYFDLEIRLDVKDVLHQIAWYRSQGLVKPEIDGNAIIDQRYVVPLPGS